MLIVGCARSRAYLMAGCYRNEAERWASGTALALVATIAAVSLALSFGRPKHF